MIARHGVADAVNQLAPNLEWHDGALKVHLLPTSSHRLSLDADTAILVPSVFVGRAIFCAAEPPGAPAPRTPLIVYPAARIDCHPPSRGDEPTRRSRTDLDQRLATKPRFDDDLE
ncbi:hypothetical protein [Streptomyces sp. NPDC001410]|uniref:hypothetical protein n=1 Tax=Streptomyces sp. NPDC001410 TaxID=3364574 RepID=UPI00368BAD06